MTYDSSISRGDASARMPQNVMGGKKKKSKKGETTALRDAAKKGPTHGGLK